MVTASTMASTNKAFKYQGTDGPSCGSIPQSSSVPGRLASSPAANAITTAAPVTDASSVKLAPPSASARKYKHDATPAPMPMPSENNQTLCSDQHSGRGNIQRSKPNPASHIK